MPGGELEPPSQAVQFPGCGTGDNFHAAAGNSIGITPGVAQHKASQSAINAAGDSFLANKVG
jgi:hypothetical protein